MLASEQVLVVPTSLLFSSPRSSFEGFRPGFVDEFLDVVSKEGFFTPREDAEEDPALKQIIPYGMVLSGQEVFLMKRSRKGGEARLQARVSLGVGGHVNPGDSSSGDMRVAVDAAFERELFEELLIEAKYKRKAIGVLNDDSNAVGEVHFGIVYRVVLIAPLVRVRERNALEGKFIPVDSVAGYREHMETWSRILQDHFWPEPHQHGEA